MWKQALARLAFRRRMQNAHRIWAALATNHNTRKVTNVLLCCGHKRARTPNITGATAEMRVAMFISVPCANYVFHRILRFISWFIRAIAGFVMEIKYAVPRGCRAFCPRLRPQIAS